MYEKIYVTNLQCWACVNSIAPELIKLTGVYNTNVNVVEGYVEVYHTDEVTREQIVQHLSKMGYPEVDHK